MTIDRTSGLSSRNLIPRRAFAVTLVSALALGGCATNPTGGAGASPPPRASIHSAQSKDYVAGAAYWGALYERDPSNAEAAAKYGSNLRQLGSYPQALMVLQRASAEHPENPAVLAEYGKLLTANGKPDQAAPILAKAGALDRSDWSIPSAEGVALDAMGRHVEAQVRYARALDLSRDNPTVLTNLGMSFALSGDLDEAETALREAVANPAAGVHARQNLSVVLALKGDFPAAERLAKADLPPDMADGNMAYLREMLTQPALWKQLEQLDTPAASAVR